MRSGPVRESCPHFSLMRGPMRWSMTGYALLALLLSGCTHSTTIPLGVPSPQHDRAEADLNARHGAVEITTIDGRSFLPRGVTLLRDSLAWTEGTTRRSEHLGNIAQVSYRSTSRGMLDGAILGALFGAAGVAATFGGDCTPGCDWGLILGVGASAGTFYGILAGLLRPARIRYRFVR